jgi:glycosyltransferase involved in cell wall biosynthesis
MDIDVVIPVRDGARFIAACLDTVMAQSRPVSAAIVVDDGSTDDTAAIVEGYGRRWPSLQLVRTAKRGLPHARNAGIARCRSEFVAFLDSDDVWEPAKLERQAALFSQGGPGLGFVHCAYYHIDANGRRIGGNVVEPRKRADPFHDLLVEGNIVSGSGSAVMARRDLLERVGGFDERLTFAEDWDLWLRLASVAKLDFVPDALVGIRLHDRSMHRGLDRIRQAEFLRQKLLVLDRWYGTPAFPRSLRRQYRREALTVAMSGRRRGVVSPLIDDWKSFSKLRTSAGRFGHELFSSPLDFFAGLIWLKLSKLRHWARGLAVGLLRLLLSPRQFDRLKNFVTSHLRRSVP